MIYFLNLLNLYKNIDQISYEIYIFLDDFFFFVIFVQLLKF